MEPRIENRIRTNSQRHDHSGAKFGHLTVEGYSHSERGRGPLWRCICDCGNICFVASKELRTGDTKSCGARIHRVKHGLCNSPEYKAWGAIKERCRDPKCKSYYRYGGRGIKVCERWFNSFEAFYADVGPRPSPQHSIDRINTFGDYEPSNCGWATLVEQQNNMRSNVFLEFRGHRMTLMQWAREIGITGKTLSTRLDRGWTVERALTQPLGNYQWRT